MERMTGSERAALFLMVMGEEFTARIFKHLDEDEIRVLGEHMTKIKKPEPRAVSVVLEEFIQTLRGGKLLGTSGESFFERTVSKAFNPKKASSLVEDLLEGKRPNRFEKLKALSPEMLVNALKASAMFIQRVASIDGQVSCASIN